MFVLKCIALLCLALTTNANIPEFIKPCHIGDNECLLKSAKFAFPYVVKGIPEIGLPSADPMKIDHVNGDIGDLLLTIKNMVVKGLSGCEIQKMNRSERMKIDMDFLCSITTSGDYKLDGNLLGLPIEGEDKFDIDIPKISVSTTTHLKTFNKNGDEHYKIANFDFKYDALEKVSFKFHNLFHGDETKAAPVHAVVNESWKEMISHIGKPVVTEVIKGVMKLTDKVYHNVPCKNLELS